MVELLREYLPVILIAVVIGLIVGLLIFKPRQRVRLTQADVPVRPHMQKPEGDRRAGNSLADEVAAATSDVTGEIIGAKVHANLPGASGPPDNLELLKGVGPKFAEALNARGIIRFDQIARLTPSEVERLDPTLGAFRGRIERDRIVEQADYLSRGDSEGFEQRFGKL